MLHTGEGLSLRAGTAQEALKVSWRGLQGLSVHLGHLTVPREGAEDKVGGSLLRPIEAPFGQFDNPERGPACKIQVLAKKRWSLVRTGDHCPPWVIPKGTNNLSGGNCPEKQKG